MMSSVNSPKRSPRAQPRTKKEFEKALELHETGNFDEAASIYKKLLQINHLNSLVLNSYGTLLYQQGNVLNALQLIKKSIILNPKVSIFYSFKVSTVSMVFPIWSCSKFVSMRPEIAFNGSLF